MRKTAEKITEVDAILELARAVRNIGIYPVDAEPGHDAMGGYVSSLTEAVMGVGKSLNNIADALHRIAAAAESHDDR